MKRTEARKRRGMVGTVWTGEVKTRVERKEKEKREKKGDNKLGNGREAAHGCSHWFVVVQRVQLFAARVAK